MQMTAALMNRPLNSSVQPDAIHGDRRSARRYPIKLELAWTLIVRNRVRDCGTGQTVDLSSDGACFDGGPFPLKANIELSIQWPVLLDQKIPMQLRIWGKIMRSDEVGTAIRITKHEWMTRKVGRGGGALCH